MVRQTVFEVLQQHEFTHSTLQTEKPTIKEDAFFSSKVKVSLPCPLSETLKPLPVSFRYKFIDVEDGTFYLIIIKAVFH